MRRHDDEHDEELSFKAHLVQRRDVVADFRHTVDLLADEVVLQRDSPLVLESLVAYWLTAEKAHPFDPEYVDWPERVRAAFQSREVRTRRNNGRENRNRNRVDAVSRALGNLLGVSESLVDKAQRKFKRRG